MGNLEEVTLIGSAGTFGISETVLKKAKLALEAPEKCRERDDQPWLIVAQASERIGAILNAPRS